MTKTTLFGLLLAALVAAPLASAQAPASDFGLTASLAEQYISPSGATDVAVEVTIGCALVLQGLEQSSIAVAATVPEWITTVPADIPVSLADCGGDDDFIITKTGVVTITPSAEAPGLTAFNLDLVATFVDAAGTPTTADAVIEGAAVDYVPGHALSPAGDQSFQVDGDAYTFDLEIEIMANARTMVMFENRVVSGGTLNGVTHKIFEVADGDRGTTYTVTWTPPEGAWTEETVTFYNYSHCLDREGCDPNMEANPTWTFVNASPSDVPSEGEKPTPGPSGVAVAGLLSAAAYRARRRSTDAGE